MPMTSRAPEETSAEPISYDAARLALAQFMIETSLRYQTLVMTYRALDHTGSNTDFPAKFEVLTDEDIDTINEHISWLGGAIPAEYREADSEKPLPGKFRVCRGFDKTGAWHLEFVDENKYRDGTIVTIFPNELPQAMKLV